MKVEKEWNENKIKWEWNKSKMKLKKGNRMEYMKIKNIKEVYYSLLILLFQ